MRISDREMRSSRSNRKGSQGNWGSLFHPFPPFHPRVQKVGMGCPDCPMISREPRIPPPVGGGLGAAAIRRARALAGVRSPVSRFGPSTCGGSASRKLMFLDRRWTGPGPLWIQRVAAAEPPLAREGFRPGSPSPEALS